MPDNDIPQNPTPQQLADYILPKLFRQGRKSCTHNHPCAYRGADGARCAVGHVIADEHYSPRLEGHSTKFQSVQTAVARSLRQTSLSKDQQYLLDLLQACHDRCNHVGASFLHQLRQQLFERKHAYARLHVDISAYL